MRSRAALFHRTGAPLEVTEIDVEEPGAGDVLVRMVAVGLCGSDLHVVRGEWPRPTPMVLGHEGAGIVEAVGAEVEHVAPGDHVVLSWAPACGECGPCRRGRPGACLRLREAFGKGTLVDGTTRLSRAGETDLPHDGGRGPVGVRPATGVRRRWRFRPTSARPGGAARVRRTHRDRRRTQRRERRAGVVGARVRRRRRRAVHRPGRADRRRRPDRRRRSDREPGGQGDRAGGDPRRGPRRARARCFLRYSAKGPTTPSRPSAGADSEAAALRWTRARRHGRAGRDAAGGHAASGRSVRLRRPREDPHWVDLRLGGSGPRAPRDARPRPQRRVASQPARRARRSVWTR